MMAETKLEPPTSRLEVQCANLLTTMSGEEGGGGGV